MMMLRRWILCLTILFLMAGIGHAQSLYPALAKSPEPGMLFLYPERIQLKGGGMFNSERGMIFVPVNRSKPGSAVIAVEVYRFKRSELAKPDTPPVFFLYGGPSFEGLEKIFEKLGAFEEQEWYPLLDISDVVVVSQRGIGLSKPTTIIETTTKPTPPDQPYDDGKAVAELQEVLRKEKAVWEGLGLDLSGFTVIEAAADVNDVRKALGYGKIVISGGSFGSHWGMNIMRYYPQIVERAILRGMEGPDHTYDHPGHLWNVYKRVAEEAEKAPVLKGLIPSGGLIKAIETVVKRVEEKPFTVTDSSGTQDVLFDGKRIRDLARGYSRGLPSWPADVITLYNGDFRKAAESIARR